jgi:hypothetical protein
MATQKLTNEILTAAIEGFEAQKKRIDDQIAAARQMLEGDRQGFVPAPEGPTRKRKMSAAARKRIGDAQRKRWAESKTRSEGPLQAPKPKRKLSAAGRMAIIEATKRRWALKRAEAEAAQTAGVRKATAKKKAATKKGSAKTAKKTSAKKTTKKVPERAAVAGSAVAQ